MVLAFDHKTVFCVINGIVLLTAWYRITWLKDNQFPTGCEYHAPGWSSAFARFAAAVSVIGIGNFVTSWKYQAIRRIYFWLVVTLGTATSFLLVMSLLFPTTGPLDQGLEFTTLQRQWIKPETWGPIEECLVENKNDICKGIVPTSPTSVLSAIDPDDKMLIRSNCCRMPSHCSFLLINGTYYPAPATDPDCKRWAANSGNPTFDSDFCKLGYLNTVLDYWLGAILLNCLIWSAGFIVCLVLEEEHCEMMKRLPQSTLKAVKQLEETDTLPQP